MTYRFFTILSITAAALLGWSCEKNALTLPVEAVTEGARIKLYHAAPEAAGVNLFVNGQKVSGFTPAGASATSPGTPVPINYNTIFPAAGANYAVIDAGQPTLRLTSPASTTGGAETALYEQRTTLETNKYYSLFVAGSGTSPEVLLVNDDFSQATDPAKFYYRFVNLIPGPARYDLVQTNGTGGVLVADVPYKGASPFLAIDAAANPAFALRLTGTSANVGTYSFTLSSLYNGRVLTIVARGMAGKTGSAAPGLVAYLNR